MNSRKKLSSIVFAMVILLLFWSPLGFGYGNEENEIKSLRGVKITGIVIDWKGQGIEDGELISDKETIRKLVGQTLNLKGIKVSERTSEKLPFLYIGIHSYTCENDLHILYVNTKVMQKVIIKSEKPINITSPIWTSGGEVCLVSAASFGNSILKQVDEFVTAYLKVNPSCSGHKDQQKENVTQQPKSDKTKSQQETISVDELLKTHAKAINYEKIKSVKTMKVTGMMIQYRGGSEIKTPYTLFFMRPGYSRIEISVQGMNIVMAYDGDIVWQVNPLRFRGSLEPVKMEGTEAMQTIIDAQLFPTFSSPLIEYRERGNSVELVGVENINGSKVYKLMASLKFGMPSYWYISSKDYSIPGFTWLAGEHDFGAKGFDVHVRLKDYVESDGIFVPHIIEDKVAGFSTKKYTIDHAEINVDIDENIFKMPIQSVN